MRWLCVVNTNSDTQDEEYTSRTLTENSLLQVPSSSSDHDYDNVIGQVTIIFMSWSPWTSADSFNVYQSLKGTGMAWQRKDIQTGNVRNEIMER